MEACWVHILACLFPTAPPPSSPPFSAGGGRRKASQCPLDVGADSDQSGRSKVLIMFFKNVMIKLSPRLETSRRKESMYLHYLTHIPRLWRLNVYFILTVETFIAPPLNKGMTKYL